MDFGLPAGTRKSPKNRPWPQSPVYFLRLQSFFWRFVRSGVFRKRPGPILEAPWTLPDQILSDFARFFGRFRRDLVVLCRVPPECCRDTPPASGTHSAGFLWGTAISRSELNKLHSFTTYSAWAFPITSRGMDPSPEGRCFVLVPPLYLFSCPQLEQGMPKCM